MLSCSNKIGDKMNDEDLKRKYQKLWNKLLEKKEEFIQSGNFEMACCISDVLLSGIEPAKSTLVVDQEMSVRSSNCLRLAGISDLKDLENMFERDYLKIKNSGRIAMREIKEILSNLGLRFRE